MHTFHRLHHFILRVMIIIIWQWLPHYYLAQMKHTWKIRVSYVLNAIVFVAEVKKIF